MIENVGILDRAFRAIIGVALAIYGWLGVESAFGIVLAVVGIVLIITALICYCPILKMLGKNTIEERNQHYH